MSTSTWGQISALLVVAVLCAGMTGCKSSGNMLGTTWPYGAGAEDFSKEALAEADNLPDPNVTVGIEGPPSSQQSPTGAVGPEGYGDTAQTAFNEEAEPRFPSTDNPESLYARRNPSSEGNRTCEINYAGEGIRTGDRRNDPGFDMSAPSPGTQESTYSDDYPGSTDSRPSRPTYDRPQYDAGSYDRDSRDSFDSRSKAPSSDRNHLDRSGFDRTAPGSYDAGRGGYDRSSGGFDNTQGSSGMSRDYQEKAGSGYDRSPPSTGFDYPGESRSSRDYADPVPASQGDWGSSTTESNESRGSAGSSRYQDYPQRASGGFGDDAYPSKSSQGFNAPPSDAGAYDDSTANSTSARKGFTPGSARQDNPLKMMKPSTSPSTYPNAEYDSPMAREQGSGARYPQEGREDYYDKVESRSTQTYDRQPPTESNYSQPQYKGSAYKQSAPPEYQYEAVNRKDSSYQGFNGSY